MDTSCQTIQIKFWEGAIDEKHIALQVQVKYIRCITKESETISLLSVDVKVGHLIIVVENVVLLLLSCTRAMLFH
jgi:hypothetical protein